MKFPFPTLSAALTTILLLSPTLSAPTACTTTLHQFPAFQLGPTSTAYLATATATSEVDCAGCAYMVVKTVELGHGPVVAFTTTVTADVTRRTDFVCATSVPNGPV